MKNILSIDTESWIHFYEDALKLRKLSSEERRKKDGGYIVRAIKDILDLLEKNDQRATFFIVAEIYHWHPEAVEEIRSRGHEIAYHTHTHPLLRSGEILKEELSLSEEFIQRFKPRGFRAPQIYLTEDSMKLLEEAGFRYSSSTYDEYIVSEYDNVKEIPVSVLKRFNRVFVKKLPKNLSLTSLLYQTPIGSGLFISLFGSRIVKSIQKLNKRGEPAIIFIHPWQLYQPREISCMRFKIKLFFKNPLCIPYTRNILKITEKILQAEKFVSFQEYYGQ